VTADIRSLDNNGSQRSKRKLAWAPKVMVHPIVPVTTFPSSVIDSIWYTSKEYATMKQEYMVTLQLATIGYFFTRSELDHEHCLRGLEHKTREGSQLRQEMKFTALISVLDEQERQLSCQYYNHEPTNTTTVNAEVLAHVYSQAVATKSRNMALIQGLKDEQEIHDYFHQVEKEKNYTATAKENFFGEKCGPQQGIVGDGRHCQLSSRICGAAA